MIQTHEQRRRDAQHIIEDFSVTSALTTFSPTALLNAMVSSWSVLLMVEKLSDLYGVPYSEQLGKGVVAALIAGVNSGWTTFLMTKIIPFVGLFVAGAPAALLNGALTYALGQSLIVHYEAGGMLHDFEPQRAQAYWRQWLENK